MTYRVSSVSFIYSLEDFGATRDVYYFALKKYIFILFSDVTVYFTNIARSKKLTTLIN